MKKESIAVLRKLQRKVCCYDLMTGKPPLMYGGDACPELREAIFLLTRENRENGEG